MTHFHYKEANQKSQAFELYRATHEAEAALLGSVLIYPSTVSEVRELVNPEDFLDFPRYDDIHSRIYRAMLACDHPDQVTVAHEMNNMGTLRRGDCAYLHQLVAEVPCPLDYLHYSQAVSDYSLQRRLQGQITKGNYPKALKLLKEHNKPKFSGGIVIT